MNGSTPLDSPAGSGSAEPSKTGSPVGEPSPARKPISLSAWLDRLAAERPARMPEAQSFDDAMGMQDDNSASFTSGSNGSGPTGSDARQLNSAKDLASHQQAGSLDWLSRTIGRWAAPPIQSISQMAMACQFEVLLNEHQYPGGVESAMRAIQRIQWVEELCSVYRPQSQFSKVNQFAAQRAVKVDAITLQIIELAMDVFHWTRGCFDITAGSLSEAWGFARRQGAMPTQDELKAALANVGSQHLQLDLQASTVRLLRPGLRLNPGGIGKGFALDLAAEILLRDGIGDFMIHGGLSSILARGQRKGISSTWTVALKHPWRTEELLETIPLHDRALGTSGSGKQFFHFGGKRYSHIIDPRTGWPADQMMSVTVLCRSAAVADALATGLFVMGIDQAMEFCDRYPQISAVFVYTDPKSGSQQILHRNWQES